MLLEVLVGLEDLIDFVGKDKVEGSQDNLLWIVEDPLVQGLVGETAHCIAK